MATAEQPNPLAALIAQKLDHVAKQAKTHGLGLDGEPKYRPQLTPPQLPPKTTSG